jgi:hypothetical protein
MLVMIVGSQVRRVAVVVAGMLAGVLVAAGMVAAPPASAEPGLPTPYPMPTYVVSGSFTVTNAVMKDGCFYHPYVIHFETTPTTDLWAVEVRVLGPDGTLQDGELKSGSGWAGGKFAGEVFLCEGIDPAGTYTLTGKVSTLGDEGDRETTMTPATFQVYPLVDVSGTVATKKIIRGARFIFRTPAQPVNTGVGDPVRWRVTFDGKTKRVTQGWGQRYVWRKQFPKGSGRHVMRVYHNEKLVKVVRARA